MKSVYYVNSRGEKRLIGKVYSDESAWATIEEFCKERNYRIYYVRIHEADGNKYYDVGSHTEHFSVEQ